MKNKRTFKPNTNKGIKRGYTLDDVTSVNQLYRMQERNEEKHKEIMDSHWILDDAMTIVLFKEDGKDEINVKSGILAKTLAGIGKENVIKLRTKNGEMLRANKAEKVALEKRFNELLTEQNV